MGDYNLPKLIALALKEENFLKYEIQVQGQTGRGDGYLGKITFVTVTDGRKTLNLVVKTSSQSPRLRNQIPIRKMFEKEIYIYDVVGPAFGQLQEHPESKSLLPKCFLTKTFEDGEVLILEDLKSQRYDVWNRKVPMTSNHIKLVLQNFGHWHALSFAMKHKQPEKFQELVQKNNLNMWPQHAERTKLFGVFFRFFEAVRNVWKDDPEVANTEFSESDIRNIFLKKITEDPDHHVILHGDSWTNNFMFKTEAGQPVDVCIIDWQLSGIASPIFDLSVFIYSCVDTKHHPDVEGLLRIYHDSVSQSLGQFNCDPAEVFSFDTLLKHWRKFSCYGIILGTFLLKFSVIESDEAPDLNEENGQDFVDKLDFETVNAEIYHKRARDNILHYVRNL